MTDDLRVEKWSNGWAVIEDVEEPCEFNNYGLIAEGCPSEADARAWMEDYRLERMCREWEDHARSDAIDPELDAIFAEAEPAPDLLR